jgi:hypothetical protein
MANKINVGSMAPSYQSVKSEETKAASEANAPLAAQEYIIGIILAHGPLRKSQWSEII